jgi:hypothetical protein
VDGTGQYGTPQVWWHRAVDGTGQYGRPQFWWRRAVLLQYHDVVPSRVMLFDAVGNRFISFKHHNTVLRNKYLVYSAFHFVIATYVLQQLIS